MEHCQNLPVWSLLVLLILRGAFVLCRVTICSPVDLDCSSQKKSSTCSYYICSSHARYHVLIISALIFAFNQCPDLTWDTYKSGLANLQRVCIRFYSVLLCRYDCAAKNLFFTLIRDTSHLLCFVCVWSSLRV